MDIKSGRLCVAARDSKRDEFTVQTIAPVPVRFPVYPVEPVETSNQTNKLSTLAGERNFFAHGWKPRRDNLGTDRTTSSNHDKHIWAHKKPNAFGRNDHDDDDRAFIVSAYKPARTNLGRAHNSGAHSGNSGAICSANRPRCGDRRLIISTSGEKEDGRLLTFTGNELMRRECTRDRRNSFLPLECSTFLFLSYFCILFLLFLQSERYKRSKEHQKKDLSRPRIFFSFAGYIVLILLQISLSEIDEAFEQK